MLRYGTFLSAVLARHVSKTTLCFFRWWARSRTHNTHAHIHIESRHDSIVVASASASASVSATQRYFEVIPLLPQLSFLYTYMHN